MVVVVVVLVVVEEAAIVPVSSARTYSVERALVVESMGMS